MARLSVRVVMYVWGRLGRGRDGGRGGGDRDAQRGGRGTWW